MSATKKMSSSSSSATKRSNAVASSSAGPSKKKARTSAPSASTSASGSKAAPAAGADSSFSYRTTRMRLSVPPRFTGDLRQGVEEMLDSMVMRFIPKLSGVLLAHSDLRFLEDKATIQADCPFAIVDVRFGALVWAPEIGQVLSGTHALSSPSHLSLLIHQTFNVSIPLNHIPPSLFTFDRSLASHEDEEAEVEDAMLGVEVEVEDDAHEEVTESAAGKKEDNRKARRQKASEGRWTHSATGRAVGAEGQLVEFTVVGLTITSNILSLTGSLLADPFNPPAPGPSQPSASTSANFNSYLDDEDEDEEAHSLLKSKRRAVVPTQNTAAVSARQTQAEARAQAKGAPKLQTTGGGPQAAPTKTRKRAVSLEFSSSDDDSEGDGPRVPSTIVSITGGIPQTGHDIDTSFPMLPIEQRDVRLSTGNSKLGKTDVRPPPVESASGSDDEAALSAKKSKKDKKSKKEKKAAGRK